MFLFVFTRSNRTDFSTANDFRAFLCTHTLCFVSLSVLDGTDLEIEMSGACQTLALCNDRQCN